MKCGQAGLHPDVSSTSFLAFSRLPLPTVLMESGWGVTLITPDRRVDPCLHIGHPPRPQLPQLTPIEFQDRGSNPVLLSQWIQKSNALTIRTWGNLLCWLGSLWVRKSYELGTWCHSDLYLTKRAHLAYKHNVSPEHSGWATKV